MLLDIFYYFICLVIFKDFVTELLTKNKLLLLLIGDCEERNKENKIIYINLAC